MPIKSFLKSTVACTALITFSFAAPAAQAADIDTTGNADTFVIFTSLDIAKNSLFSYTGGIAAINGDLGADGFLVRGGLTVGDYDYRLPGGKVDADVLGFDVMAGYQMHLDAMRLSAYAGVDYSDTDLSRPDPANQTAGSKVGAKFQAELSSVGDSPFYFSAIGSYSTRHNSYWTRGRVGYNLGIFTLGPEVLGLGDKEFDQFRFGGFANFQLPSTMNNIKIGFSGGYADTSGLRNSDGAYGHMSMSIAF